MSALSRPKRMTGLFNEIKEGCPELSDLEALEISALILKVWDTEYSPVFREPTNTPSEELEIDAVISTHCWELASKHWSDYEDEEAWTKTRFFFEALGEDSYDRRI